MFHAVDSEGTVWETGSLSECQEFAKKYLLSLHIQETTAEAERIRDLERWIAQGGETPFWRYPPSGGENPEPTLPQGYKVIGDRNRYWVIGRV